MPIASFILALPRRCARPFSGGVVTSLTDAPPPRLATRSSTLVFVLAVILKLVLISHDELIAAPSDPTEFAFSAAHFYFGMPYQESNYARLGTYPLFLTLNTILGIPARLGIEAVWCTAAFVILIALVRLGLSRWIATLAGVMLVLLPMSIAVLNTVHADALYAPAMLVLVLATSVSCIATSRGEFARWGLTAALAAALTTCRAEIALTYFALAGPAVLIAVCRIAGMIDRPLFFRRLRAAFITPILAVLIFTTAIKLANLYSIRSYVDQDLSSPGLARLYNALLAIPPETPSLVMQIPRDVREKAYAVSPTFARFKPYLESPGIPSFQAACQRVCLSRGLDYVPGEYGGWTIWALRSAVWKLQPHASPRDVDTLYQRAAGEIRSAMVRGDLPSRFAPFSYVAPEWGLLLQDSPRAALRTLSILTKPDYAPPKHAVFGPEEQRRQRLFNSATLRRAQLLKLPDQGRNISQWHSQAVADALTAIKLRLDRAFAWLPILAIALAPIAVILASRARSPTTLKRFGLLVIALAAGGMLSARLLMITAIELSGVPSQTRYLFPCAAIIIVLLALCIEVIFASLRGRNIRLRETPSMSRPSTPGPA